jgi:hypothetical protein
MNDIHALAPSQPGSGLPAADAAANQLHRMAIIRNLVATMMLGKAYGMHEQAEAIFRAASTMLGNGRSLRISLALAAALGGDTGPAHELLDGDLCDWPEAEPAMVSIALALKVAGEDEWLSLINQTLSVSVDEQTRQFAQQVMRVDVPPRRSRS